MINKDALDKNRVETKLELYKLLEKYQRVLINRPCSWGKTHLIAEICNEKKGKKLILEPTNILEDYISKKYNSLLCKNVIIDTYQNLLHKKKSEIKEMYGDIDYIFLDEVHRAGAKKWNKAIEILLSIYFNAKVIGMSATPIRSDGNDILKTIFGGVQVTPLFLGEAIKKEMLPNVCYVTALYTITEQYNETLDKINKASNVGKERKSLLVDELNRKFLEYEKLNNIPNILQKYLFTGYHLHNMKFIVFCNNIKEIEGTKKLVKEWFEKCYDGTGVNKEINLYDVHYKKGRDENRKITNLFEQKHKDNVIDIIISVNMFNEGLHLNGITGVILLRETTSNIVYFQQIGRVISQENELPFVFDFVNNYKSVMEGYISLFEESDPWEEIETDKNGEWKTKRGEQKYYTDSGEVINIHDEAKDLCEISRKIISKIKWSECLYRDLDWLQKNAENYTLRELQKRYNDEFGLAILDTNFRQFFRKYNIKWKKKVVLTQEEKIIKYLEEIDTSNMYFRDIKEDIIAKFGKKGLPSSTNQLRQIISSNGIPVKSLPKELIKEEEEIIYNKYFKERCIISSVCSLLDRDKEIVAQFIKKKQLEIILNNSHLHNSDIMRLARCNSTELHKFFKELEIYKNEEYWKKRRERLKDEFDLLLNIVNLFYQKKTIEEIAIQLNIKPKKVFNFLSSHSFLIPLEERKKYGSVVNFDTKTFKNVLFYIEKIGETKEFTIEQIIKKVSLISGNRHNYQQQIQSLIKYNLIDFDKENTFFEKDKELIIHFYLMENDKISYILGGKNIEKIKEIKENYKIECLKKLEESDSSSFFKDIYSRLDVSIEELQKHFNLKGDK